MSASSKRRSNRPRQDSLRPGWMVNCILFSILMAAIGACYVWLGSRQNERADQILTMRREIEGLEKRLQEHDLLMYRRLAPEDLRASAAKAGLDLKPIDIGPKGRLIRLPDPVIANQPYQIPPVLAGNRQP